MVQQVNLQIPISKDLKESGEKFIQSLGYSSLQEWFRVQLTGLLKGTIKIESVISSDDYLDYMTPEYEKYLSDTIAQGRKESKEGKTLKARSVEEMMDILNKD